MQVEWGLGIAASMSSPEAQFMYWLATDQTVLMMICCDGRIGLQ